jgi:hypothetical protein
MDTTTVDNQRSDKARNTKRNRKTRVRNIAAFDKGNIRMFLRSVVPYNKETGCYEEPLLRLVTLVDGKYVRVPLDPGLLKEWGTFIQKVGTDFESECQDRIADTMTKV